jgi:DUF4097 and DUF4098 domain-containing protein YvlB
MTKWKITFLFIIIFSMLFSADLFAWGKKEIQKSFDSKKLIKIKLILGECIIQKSTDQKKIYVDVVYTYDDEDFEARFREKEKSLNIQEKLYGQNNGGYSKWTISIPEDIEVDLSSATGGLYINGTTVEIDGNTGTGDIEIKDAKGEFDLNTGTGDVLAENCEGEFELNSGTGRVLVENCKGAFDVNSGTGDVEGQDIEIEDEAEFNSGTGDAEVSGPKGDDFDLSINSGTDDATLILDGTPLEGYFELSAQSRRGSIRCPVDFDDEKEYYDGDNRYVRKSFTKGKETPRYFISTGTGTAKLKR